MLSQTFYRNHSVLILIFYELTIYELSLKYEKPICHAYFKKKFDEYEFNWKLIYRIPCIATYESKARIFQCKLLNNVLYCNKILFHFCIISQSKRFFCELYDETPRHLFYECAYALNLWNQLRLYLSEKVALPFVTPQSVNFGFTDVLD